MLLPLALAFVAAAAPADSTRGAIRGSVQSEPSGLPVAQARVEIKTAGGTRVVFADSTGEYRLGEVPAGRHTFRVGHIDHLPTEMEVLVPAGRVVELDVTLKLRPVALPPVSATAEGAGGAGGSPAAGSAELAEMERRAREEGLGGVADAFGGGSKSKQPGQDPPDPDDVLYVRGSAADLKLVLLDGVPVYAPFHMGGLIDTFEPGVLRSARMHLGGAPARYDGGLSYVMELQTRRGDTGGFHSSGAVDLVSARGIAEGPLPGGASFLFSGRGIHTATLAQLEGEPFPYQYYDGLARLEIPVDSASRLALTLFSNSEGVRVDTFPGRDNFARWGNTAASLRYRGVLLRAQGELTVAYSGFGATLPSYRRDSVDLDRETHRLRLALDLERRYRDILFRYGWSYDRTVLNHQVRDVAGERRVRIDNQLAGDVGGGYVEGTWTGRRVSLRGGVRADMFSHGALATFSPRLEAKWLLAERAVLTLAGGRYHQFVRTHEPVRIAEIVPVGGQPPTEQDSLDLPSGLVVAGANHLSLALDQELVTGLRLGLEGYFKHFDGLPDAAEVGANHSGVDVWVRGSTGGLTGWMGYSLAWVWDAPVDNQGYSDRFAGRQLLSAGLSGEYRPLGRLGLRLAYGSGLPFTAVEAALPNSPEAPGGLSSSADRLDFTDDPSLAPRAREPYLRVDAEVSRTFAPRLGARRTELTPYLKVINALDGRDGLFYRYDADRGDADVIAALPLLPVFGVQWKF